MPVAGSASVSMSLLVPLLVIAKTAFPYGSTSRQYPLLPPPRAVVSKKIFCPMAPVNEYRFAPVAGETLPETGAAGVIGVAVAVSMTRKLYGPVFVPAPLIVSLYCPATRSRMGLPSLASELFMPRRPTSRPSGPVSDHWMFELFIRLSKNTRESLPSVKT